MPLSFNRVYHGLAVGGLIAVLAVAALVMAMPAMAGEPAATDAPAEKTMMPEGVQPLPVPRFVTLAPNEVNLRTGPGIRYPIRTVIRKQSLPVEVVREFDVWRQVRDREGDEGWVHKSMLSGRRSVIIEDAAQTLVRKPEPDARPVVRLEPGVIATLETCRSDWCQISVGGFTGWTRRDKLWGVYPDEQFKD